jgi:hypothetical protein
LKAVNKIFESYSEKDLAKNKNDKHFPFPLKEDGERNAVGRLTYQNKIIIEIKSDPILFCNINDLLWGIYSSRTRALRHMMIPYRLLTDG